MATQQLSITPHTVHDISTLASLVDDTNYWIQVTGSTAVVFSFQDIAPTETGGAGIVIPRHDFILVQARSGSKVYCWTAGGISNIAITEQS